MDTIEKLRTVLENVREPSFGHTLGELHAVRTVRELSDGAPHLEIRLGFPSDAAFDRALSKRVQEALRETKSPDVMLPIRKQVLSHRVKHGLKPLDGVKNIIAVSSAKGGVGKSTVSVALALSLVRLGARVGLLDADIYGPSVPLLLNLHEKPVEADEQTMLPIFCGKLQVNSIGFFVGPTEPLAWRGPMASGAIRRLAEKTQWDNLDYLIVDMPPGTGDIQLTIAQSLPVTAALVVTTPQKLACADAARGLRLFEKVGIPVLGIVENMAFFVCPECGHVQKFYGDGHTKKLSERFAVPVIASLPFDRQAEDLMSEVELPGDFDRQIDRAALFLAQTVSRMPKDMTAVMPKVRIEDVLSSQK